MRIVLMVVLSLVLTAPAQAATSWKHLANLAGPPVSAGHGLIVAQYGPHGLAVIGPTGVQRTYDFGPLCAFKTAGGGRAVASCSLDATRWYASLDLATGTTTRLDPFSVDRLDSDYGPDITEVGARWVGVSIVGNHYGYTAYWNPETGQVHNPFGARTTVNLDAEEVRAPLCSPVRRPRYPAELSGGGGYDPYGRVTVVGRRVFYSIETSFTRVGLFMWRCGSGKPKRVATCADPSPCADYTADKQHLAWLGAANRVIVMNVKTGKRTKLTPPRGLSKITSMVLSADDRLYVADGRSTAAVTRLPHPS
jgi:hypothetical protein